MYGAIIGDLAGSIYEYEQFRKVKTIKVNKLIEDNAFYSDDTILTIAILDAILNDRDYDKYLRKYIVNYSSYKPKIIPYFENSFSPATIPSHNSKEAIECATKIALMIFYFRNGLSKEEVYDKLNITLKYTPFEKFNGTCVETIDNCLYVLYTSNSFEEAIKKIISLGGDTDTNAAIVGSVAEAMYGIDDNLKAVALEKLPKEFIEILEKTRT